MRYRHRQDRTGQDRHWRLLRTDVTSLFLSICLWNLIRDCIHHSIPCHADPRNNFFVLPILAHLNHSAQAAYLPPPPPPPPPSLPLTAAAPRLLSQTTPAGPRTLTVWLAPYPRRICDTGESERVSVAWTPLPWPSYTVYIPLGRGVDRVWVGDFDRMFRIIVVVYR